MVLGRTGVETCTKVGEAQRSGETDQLDKGDVVAVNFPSSLVV